MFDLLHGQVGRPPLGAVLFAAGAWFFAKYLTTAIAIWIKDGAPFWSMLLGPLGAEALTTGALLMLAPATMMQVQRRPEFLLVLILPLAAVRKLAIMTAQQRHLASVDPLTEAQIQEGLDLLMHGRTSIVIAHRLSTIRHVDRIIVLRQGEIVEEGSHDVLMHAGGHYAHRIHRGHLDEGVARRLGGGLAAAGLEARPAPEPRDQRRAGLRVQPGDRQMQVRVERDLRRDQQPLTAPRELQHRGHGRGTQAVQIG